MGVGAKWLGPRDTRGPAAHHPRRGPFLGSAETRRWPRWLPRSHVSAPPVAARRGGVGRFGRSFIGNERERAVGGSPAETMRLSLEISASGAVWNGQFRCDDCRGALGLRRRDEDFGSIKCESLRVSKDLFRPIRRPESMLLECSPSVSAR